MRIATLQFAPKLGDVEGNINRANELLKGGKHISFAGQSSGIGIGIDMLRPDILVLPELALTGYNFPSKEAIKPYLEPTGAGPSATWARDTAKRLHCKVCIGYPEIEHSDNEAEQPKYYNSLLVVDETGAVIHNYRKSFLYFTDETWAAEGSVELGFQKLAFTPRGEPESMPKSTTNATASPAQQEVPTSFGICMDINPYKFEAPYTAYEFANRVLDSGSQLVILSMAWLTLMGQDEIVALNGKPDMDTFSYWLNRFMPLLEKKMRHEGDIDRHADRHGASSEAGTKRTVIIFANRAGEEPAADDTKPPARYAGTSAVIAVTQQIRTGTSGSGSQVEDGIDGGEEGKSAVEAKIACWDLLGAGEEGICFADTTVEPKMVFGLRKRRGSGEESSGEESEGSR
ncbi:Protein N-terminal amidase [Penicillium rolfsii]|nr:Protein N-terminal amidase [Penicillium rolfsii]